MNEQDLMAELDPRELAILDAYREASEPSPEVEDRLFARLQAAIEVEENTPYHAAASRDVPHEDEGTRKGTSPVTTVVVAIAAFAAGVALTVGLRGTIAQAVEDSDDRSTAPMVAEDAGPQGTARNAGGQACEVVEVPVRVEVPVPVEAEDDDANDAPRDRRDDEREGGESIENTPPQRGWSGPTDRDDEDDDARRVERRTQVIAVSQWSSTHDGTGDDRPPRQRRRRRRRGSRATGVGRGSGATGSSRPEPHRPAGNSGSGSSGPKSSPSGKPGSKPGSGHGGHGGPNTPPPPSPGDNPPPEPPPWDEDPPPDDPDRCLADWERCMIDVDQQCMESGEPEFCDHSVCDPIMWECGGDGVPPEEPPVYEECEQEVSECYEFAELECNEAQDPEICDDIFYNCDVMAAECYGEPPPPPMWPEAPPPQDQGDENPDGQVY